LMSRAATVGAVLATDAVPPVYRFGEGYRAGAKYVNPAVNVVVVFHNDVGIDKTFSDPEWGKTTAQAQIERGVDVIFGAGGKTGNGALIGTVERGGLAIGVDLDQWYTVPEARKGLLSSAMKLLTPSTTQVIRTAKEGTFTGGLFSGQVGLAPFHALDGEVPEAVKARLVEIDRGLADGSIKSGVPPVKS
jgi:basic membrane protein A and related proteins